MFEDDFTPNVVYETKYLVCPGWITSKSGGDRHFISARQLMELYKVHPRECLVFEPHKSFSPNLIKLNPRYDGDYTIPKRR